MDINKLTPEELVEVFSNAVNNFSFKPKEFAQAILRQHRTLQQNMIRTMLVAVETMAEVPDNRLDARNEDSRNVCRDIVESFGDKMDFPAAKPSQYLGHI